MKKNKKIIAVILIVFMALCTCVDTFAASSLTTQSLKKSLEGYAKGEKKAVAEFGNSKLTIGGNSENLELQVTDTTITMNGMTYNYVIESNKIRLSYDVEVVAGETDYIAKTMYPMGYPTLFVAITDVFGIDSNKSLYYYGKINNSISDATLETVPDSVDTNDGLSWFKYLETKGQFKDLSNNVFSITNKIEENSEERFKYIGILEINLDKLNIITDFEATSYIKTNTVENEVVLKVTNTAKANTSTQSDLPYSGLEDDNTFIGVALVFIGISLILYVRYASLKLKEN